MVTSRLDISSWLGITASEGDIALIVAQCVGTCTCSLSGSGMVVCVSLETSCGGGLGAMVRAVSVVKF